MDFKEKFDKWTGLVNDALDRYVAVKFTPEENIYKAMKYSLMAGGKRLRPVLALAVCEMLGGDENDILPYACAIEMIHTYSLIHDDLPAMDNDDYRRGMPTNHKVFGEAVAILAGDALLNFAFELMLRHTLSSDKKQSARLKAMETVARSAGVEGMIGGQVVDLESEGKSIPADLLEYMHKCKTGALIKAPVLAAAILFDAKPKEYGFLEEYSEKIGLAFQIKDDIMDVESSFEDMGKTAGSDAANGKSTFITLYGMEESKRLLNTSINQAVEALNFFGAKAAFLKELASYIEKRQN
jgi:geranylgeranyl diphosphate synthase, type II